MHSKPKEIESPDVNNFIPNGMVLLMAPGEEEDAKDIY